MDKFEPRFDETTAIGKLRAHLELTQEDFALELGISINRPSLWENGHQAISSKTVLTICDRYKNQLADLGLTAVDLLEG
jgi:DNA-binding transcriptional regulator YiaG